MPNLTFSIPLEALDLSDSELAALIREAVSDRVQETHRKRLEADATARRKLGHRVVIDGVTYDSKTQARKSLGIAFQTFKKRYPDA